MTDILAPSQRYAAKITSSPEQAAEEQPRITYSTSRTTEELVKQLSYTKNHRWPGHAKLSPWTLLVRLTILQRLPYLVDSFVNEIPPCVRCVGTLHSALSRCFFLSMAVLLALSLYVSIGGSLCKRKYRNHWLIQSL